MTLPLYLDAVQFACWCCVYLYAIRNGFRYRTWCIPAVSICINFSWELWSVVLRLRSGSVNYGLWVSAVWLLLDVGVAATLICHYRRIPYRQTDRQTDRQTASNCWAFHFGAGGRRPAAV